MLSRTANHLYWLSRYMERAENLVRILDVSFSVTLMPSSKISDQELHIPLYVTDSSDDYFERYAELSRDNLLLFFTLDEQNPNSIINCFARARDNAKAVRSIISSEIWEALNTAWLELQSFKRNAPIADARLFFEWVKAQSHLFRGAIYGTILRNESFKFLRLGTSIERADNTARILSNKSQFSLQSQSVQHYRWSTLLRSLGAFEAYHQIYGDQITPQKIADLLILREEVPRSLLACLESVYTIVDSIEGKQGRETKRLTSIAYNNLNYGNTRAIFKQGISEYSEQFLTDLNDLANSIQKTYMEIL